CRCPSAGYTRIAPVSTADSRRRMRRRPRVAQTATTSSQHDNLDSGASLEGMYKSNSITVIIPCLNEEQGIEQVMRRMPEFVDQIIVVDNGSTDRTSEIARGFGAKVIREDVRGYGRSYKRGFSFATGDIIVTLDGDHSYPPDAIPYLLEAFLHLEVDFLNAARFPVR